MRLHVHHQALNLFILNLKTQEWEWVKQFHFFIIRHTSHWPMIFVLYVRAIKIQMGWNWKFYWLPLHISIFPRPIYFYFLNGTPPEDHFSLQILIACQKGIINVYDLQYSRNPLECSDMLIGLGIVLGVIGVAVIVSLIGCGCWKQRAASRQLETRTAPTRERPNLYSTITRLSRLFITNRYPRMEREETSVRQVHMNYDLLKI